MMEDFEVKLVKEQNKKQVIKQIAANTGQSIGEVRAAQPVQTHGFTQTELFQPQPDPDTEDEGDMEMREIGTGEQGNQTDRISQGNRQSQTMGISQGTQGNQTVGISQGSSGSQTTRKHIEDQDVQTDPMEIAFQSSESSSSKSKGVIKKAMMKQAVSRHLNVKDQDLPNVAMNVAANYQQDFAAQHLEIEKKIQQSRQQEAEQLVRITLEEDNSKSRLASERRMHEEELMREASTIKVHRAKVEQDAEALNRAQNQVLQDYEMANANAEI